MACVHKNTPREGYFFVLSLDCCLGNYLPILISIKPLSFVYPGVAQVFYRTGLGDGLTLVAGLVIGPPSGELLGAGLPEVLGEVAGLPSGPGL